MAIERAYRLTGTRPGWTETMRPTRRSCSTAVFGMPVASRHGDSENTAPFSAARRWMATLKDTRFPFG